MQGCSTIVEIKQKRKTQSSEIDDLGVRSWKRQRISSVEASELDSGTTTGDVTRTCRCIEN